MSAALPKPSQPQPQKPSELKRSVAPSGVPKMDGVNPALAPKPISSGVPGKTESVSGKTDGGSTPLMPGSENTVPPKTGSLESAVPAGSKPSLSPSPTAPLPAGVPLASPSNVPSPSGGKPPALGMAGLAGAGGVPPTLGSAGSAAAKPGAASANSTPAVGAPPIIAKPQRDWKKLAMIGGVFVVGFVLIWTLLSRFLGGSSSTPSTTTPTNTNTPGAQQPGKQVVLTYWGLWEPSEVLEETLKEYEAAHPGITIDYRVQSHKDYRQRLQTAIASGNGPDVFRYHASWVPMLSSELAVLPASVMSATEFKESFYPVAAQQLQIGGKIVGLPIMYEGLGLYYNKDILQTAGVNPPDTWAELKKLASDLSVPADRNARRSGTLTRGGLAIGNTSNVDHFPDILALLILQNGGNPAEPAFTEVRDALTFYSNFVREDAVWSSSLPSSTVAFARGDVAMMFAPSWRAHEIRELNPSLNFGIAPVPQLSDEQVAWASFWAEGVNEKSAHKQEAWEFLRYMTSADVMKKLYSAQSQVRAFGEPYSRVDLKEELSADPYVEGILRDAPIATGWYMNSATHDNGINDEIIGYYAAALNSLASGETIDEILLTLEQGVKQVLNQYGVSASQ